MALTNTYTVTDLLDAYERDCFPRLSEGTQYQNHSLYRAFRRELGTIHLADLTPARLQAWCHQLTQRYAPSTVRRRLYALSAPLAVAVRFYGWLDTNPMTRVIYPAAPLGRVRFLSEEERMRLLLWCRLSQNPHLALVVLLALTTGARKNELLGLRWSEVDVTRGVLRFLRTKGQERRAVPVTGVALEGLRQRWASQHEARWVFPRADGLKPVLIEDAWRTARKRAQLVDFRFHDLRHTAASYLAMSGASLRDIAEILGHKSLKQTFAYQHLTEGHTREVLERMSDKYLR